MRCCHQAVEGDRISFIIDRQFVSLQVAKTEDDMRQLFNSQAIGRFGATGIISDNSQLLPLGECQGWEKCEQYEGDGPDHGI